MTRISDFSTERLLDRNPKIDQEVVRRWRFLNEQVVRLGGNLSEGSGEYRINHPFGTLKRTSSGLDTPREIRLSARPGHGSLVTGD